MYAQVVFICRKMYIGVSGYIQSFFAATSIIHRLSIEFASNLHRLCNGGLLEEHCDYEVPISCHKD